MNSEVDPPETADNKVPSPNISAGSVADRLRRSLSGRDREAVVETANISDRTLTRALSGETVRRGTWASIAEALGVRLEWLLSGEGPIGPELAGAPTPHQPKLGQMSGHPPLFRLAGAVDPARIGAAIRIAVRNHPKPDTAAEWRALGDDFIELYDLMTEQADAALQQEDGLGNA